MIIEPIFRETDYEGIVRIWRHNDTTGLREPATGLTDIVMFFSLTEGGDEIDSAVRWALTELSGKPGRYVGILDQGVMVTHLEPLGTSVFWKAIAKPGDTIVYSPCKYVWGRPS